MSDDIIRSVDQYECEHGHRCYDGDQGVGNPYEDGYHDAGFHAYSSGVLAWEPWERDAYKRGYADGRHTGADR